MLKIFISGLEKQSGKTILTAGIAGTMQSLSYSTSVYKPVQTGALFLNGTAQSQDLVLVNKIDKNIKTKATYLFPSPLIPLVSAYEANSKIDMNDIYSDYYSNMQMTECCIVEGSNSISAPITENATEADLVKALGLPLILVVNSKKTTVDKVISAINYIYSRKIDFRGIIVNEYDELTKNLEEKYFPQLVKEFTNANVLGVIPHYENIQALTPDTLIEDILNRVNIEDIFGVKIAKLNS